MKIITTLGFHATGSGAVDDFLREFDNIKFAPTEYECRFLQDPDGISDLEYNLIDNPHRLNSGFALKRYLKFVKNNRRMYKRIFGDKWEELSKDYVESLITVKYKGYWHRDIEIVSPLKRWIYYGRKVWDKAMPKPLKKRPYYNYFPNLDYYHSYITRDKFYEETRKYCYKLCEAMNTENKEYVLLDQVVPTSNIPRYANYIEGLKMVIVERDPRDVFISQQKSYVLPKTVDEFITVYRDHRKIGSDFEDGDNILRVQFEDLIYKYDEMMEKIMKFFDLKEENHKYPKKYFNPDISIKNIQSWKRETQWSDEVKLIEKELKEYLYDFK